MRTGGVQAALVGMLALLVFGYDLPAEPHFADESAYLSQSYFAEVFASGRWNDAAWVELMGYDLPPLPKYMIGAALTVGGYRLHGPAEARAWYYNDELRFGTPGALTAARVPSVIAGAIGCMAVYGIGVLVAGQDVGLVAALMLVANPLYRMLARRAMSDVPCEAFTLLALWLALWVGTRLLAGRFGPSSWLGAVASGVAVGLALLSKLSGTLGLMVVLTWVALAMGLRVPSRRKIAVVFAALIVGSAALATFVALDPFLTAKVRRPLLPALDAVNRMGPVERARMMFRLRLEFAASQQKQFRHNALANPVSKLTTVAVQGFGRFGPLGPAHSNSVRWLDPRQDWGALVWLPWVLAGLWWARVRAGAQKVAGEWPTAFALMAQFAVVLTVVTAYLPMAWDRYELPVQAPSALLAAGAAVAGAGRLRTWLSLWGPHGSTMRHGRG